MALELLARRLARGRLRHDDVIARRELLAVVTEGFAQRPLDPVASDGMRIDLARHGQAHARGRGRGVPVHRQARRRGATALGEDAIEVGFCAHPCLPRKTQTHGEALKKNALMRFELWAGSA